MVATLALLALLFPTRWGSEYVLAIPAALLALERRDERSALLAGGLIMAMLMPGIQEPLIRCHRFAGVVLLLFVLGRTDRGGKPSAANSARSGSASTLL